MMIEPQNNDDRWGELAAQLGLDDRPKTTATSRQPENADDARESAPESEPLAAADDDLRVAESELGDDDPQKRRRGRRSGRGRGKSAPDTADGVDTPTAVGQDQPGQKKRRTRRPATEAAEPTGEPSRSLEADDDEIDNLSDWTVPSWTDLIDSLHRPDR